ncbi:hypothetical protein PVK06_026933 [Gossypium arboreum]|uniref:Uncharacterized protein n=1 Tax=Gossypium arboreum TaxID=29729 RepID=A0ABR0P085_GOSAR|nr:hypothetical protein PVK06_026933 [Gossypium arboreum]
MVSTKGPYPPLHHAAKKSFGQILTPPCFLLSESQTQSPTLVGPKNWSVTQAQVEVQRLRDQMAQMQVSTVEEIAQLKAEAASLKEEAAAREAEKKRKYNELQLQLQNMMQMFQQSQKPPS